MTDPLSGREIIFEFYPVGTVMRVAAMDSQSLTEIILQMPRTATPEAMKSAALRRMAYVLRKKGLI